MVCQCSSHRVNGSHLLVTNFSPSTALELLLLEASAKSQHIAIRMQFIFQNYLSQFASMPAGDKFRTCQEMYNRILSAQRGVVDRKFREYVGPASVVVGGIMGAMAVPAVMGISAEVSSRQAQRERVFEEEPDARQPLQRSKSMNMKLTGPGSPGIRENVLRTTTSASLDVRRPSSPRSPTIPLSSQRSSSATHFSNKHSQLMSQSQPNLQPPSLASHRPSPLRPVSPSAFT